MQAGFACEIVCDAIIAARFRCEIVRFVIRTHENANHVEQVIPNRQSPHVASTKQTALKRTNEHETKATSQSPPLLPLTK